MDGQIFGKYKVTRKLGEGGMGAVYAAEHEQLGSRVAIKVLLAEWLQQEEIVKRFKNEALATARIKHPGMVEIHDSGQTDEGAVYIVMEYLEGEDLYRRMRKRGRLPPPQALLFAQQMCSALQAAHDLGVIHRDLKPGNVFLVPDPQVPGGERIKLLDFGIAKVRIENNPNAVQTRNDAMMGTPTYMAPEQCSGATNVDQRSDVYAVGCILFEMLCGRTPFIGDKPTDVMVMKMRDDPPRASSMQPEVWPELDEVLSRALARDANHRYASASQFGEALGGLLAGFSGPMTAGPTTRPRTNPVTGTFPGGGTVTNAVAPGTVAVTPQSRSRWPLVASMLVTLVLAGGAAVYVLGPREPAPAPAALVPAPVPAAPPPLEFRQIERVDAAIEKPLSQTLWILDAEPGPAEVVYQDEVRGQTPIAILVERDAERRERITLRYDPENYGEQHLELSAARDVQQLVELQPYIDVKISSKPPKADVYTPDDEYQGRTPMTMSLPRTDEKRILELRRDGYLTQQIAVDFSVPGELNFDLERAVSVLIDSNPSGADVWLEGEHLGETLYRAQLPLKPGRRNFRLTLEGCREETVRLRANQDDSALVTLKCE